MKRWKMLLLVLVLVLTCAACGGNDEEVEEKVDNDVEIEQSEDVTEDVTEAATEDDETTHIKENKTYKVVSETEDKGVEITIPGEFQETDYMSESWLALEIPGDDADSSTQLMMYLEADASVDVKKNMVEEVNYLMSANTDDWEEIDYVEGVSADCHEWAYVEYELEGLKGYKFCAKMENNTVLAGTVELLGESPKAFDIVTFIRQMDETIKVE